MTSANSAMPIKATMTTMPMPPSGFRRNSRANCPSDEGFDHVPGSGLGMGIVRAECAISVPDPWIDDRVEEVDEQIDGDDRRDHDQRNALDHRVVSLHDGIEEELAD